MSLSLRFLYSPGLTPGLTLTLFLAASALAGCGGQAESGPGWLSLSRGFQAPPPRSAVEAWRSPTGAPYLLAEDDEGAGFWLGRRIPGQEWKREAKRAGFWSADRSLLGLAGDSAAVTRLQAGELAFRTTTPRDAPELLAAGTPCYFLMARRILIGLPAGQELPEELIFSAFAERGSERDGVWRARSGFLTADGVALLSGQQYERVIDVPPHSQLFFGTSAVGIELGASLRWRVFLDGTLLFDHTEDTTANVVDRHVVPLGDELRERAVLRFEVSGDPGVGTFVTPLVGPEVGPQAARNPDARRPDVVIFLADTFRADNLTLYGCTSGRAPELDALAAESVRFQRAQSSASWTLPAMSSLLTGLYPPQHGAEIESVAISDGLVTLAEQLAAHGYRTGAVTDSGFVAADYGMDQGFEVFQEYPAVQWSLKQTLDWSLDFLERDDGRPAFLLVHTYRTHYPYRQGPEEDFSAWIDTLQRAGIEDWKVGRPPEELMPYADDFRSLYEDGVAALDDAFGAWWTELEERGWTDRGVFVFTSDHGEAFGEHVEFGHGGKLWGEKLRVPLLIHAPGLEPRDEKRAASLVDLPVTLAALAGIPSASGWEGLDLTRLAEDRPLLAYNAGVGGDCLSIVSGLRKVVSLPDADVLSRGEFTAAYDLAADPGEQAPSVEEVPWAVELCRSLAERVAELSVPLAAARRADLSQAKQDELEAIGYGGD